MEKYNELKNLKANGKEFNWDKITKEELTDLFENGMTDSMIAELYNVTTSKVKYKRTKWDIKFRFQILEQDNFFQSINNDSKKRLLDKNNMDILAKSITHYIFRNRTCRRYA